MKSIFLLLMLSIFLFGCSKKSPTPTTIQEPFYDDILWKGLYQDTIESHGKPQIMALNDSNMCDLTLYYNGLYTDYHLIKNESSPGYDLIRKSSSITSGHTIRFRRIENGKNKPTYTVVSDTIIGFNFIKTN